MGEEERGEAELGRPRQEVGGGLTGTRGVGAGTVTGAGVGLPPQPHGIMGLMTEPAGNRNGPAADGSGSTYVSRCARPIVEVGTDRSSASSDAHDFLEPGGVGLRSHAARRSGAQSNVLRHLQVHDCSKSEDAGRRSKTSGGNIGGVPSAILTGSPVVVDGRIGGTPR
jgi:hypothetical protein